MYLLEAQKNHIVGIGGIGVSGVAKILKLRGAQVSGSDVASSVVTDELNDMGIPVAVGHAASNLLHDCDALIYSGAVPRDNAERAAARDAGIPEFSYSEALGELTRARRTIAVSGTHGKSTTTAMLGSILVAAGLDPLVLVGTRVTNFSHGNVQWGTGEWMVVEACEHEAQMMQLTPQRIIITNLESDHLDYYGTFERLCETFRLYVSRVTPDSCVINGDDASVRALFNERDEPLLFGFQDGALQCMSRESARGMQRALLRDADGNTHELRLKIPGGINVMNAMAAFLMARSIGVSAIVALDALAAYPGSWRRFERVGEFHGAPVISDYGHHPTAVRQTVAAAREFFPDRRILLVYQPHQHHRTAALREEFITALATPDALVLCEIYDVAGREQATDQHISSQHLVESIRARHPNMSLWYARTFVQAREILEREVYDTDVVLVMGAGDIYTLAHELCR